jgi:hypothetical protein
MLDFDIDDLLVLGNRPERAVHAVLAPVHGIFAAEAREIGLPRCDCLGSLTSIWSSGRDSASATDRVPGGDERTLA